MSKIIIFGTNDYAQLAHFYLTQDSPHKPVAFMVDPAFKDKETFCGLPVITHNELNSWLVSWRNGHPTDNDIKLFAPLRDNKLRRYVFNRYKNLGYDFISYVSGHARVFINVEIGKNCFILEGNNLQPFSRIGDNVVLWSGNHIGHHSTIEDDVTITSHVVVSGHCLIGNGCFLGVNSTIRDGVEITPWTTIGQAANVTKRIQVPGTYIGNPAKQLILEP